MDHIAGGAGRCEVSTWAWVDMERGLQTAHTCYISGLDEAAKRIVESSSDHHARKDKYCKIRIA